ncbi:MAG: LacI family DNA-binding transcriptional regulator [Eisenbergiella massiliensis]
MTTIKQIAEELGVSPTTVSNVINGRTGKMSLETRRKIEEALWENHYETAGKSSSASSGENMIAVGFCMGGYCNVLTDPFVESFWVPSRKRQRNREGTSFMTYRKRKRTYSVCAPPGISTAR